MTTSTDCTAWKSAALLELVHSLAVSVTAGNLDQTPAWRPPQRAHPGGKGKVSVNSQGLPQSRPALNSLEFEGNSQFNCMPPTLTTYHHLGLRVIRDTVPNSRSA